MLKTITTKVAGVVLANVALDLTCSGLYDVKAAALPNDHQNKSVAGRAGRLVRGVGLVAAAGIVCNVATDLILGTDK